MKKPEPPQGFESWLQYAIATMNTRQPSIEQVINNTGDGDREAMELAVQEEYNQLIDKIKELEGRVDFLNFILSKADVPNISNLVIEWDEKRED